MVRLKMTTVGGKSIEDFFEIDNGMSGTLAADFTEGHIERMFTHDGQEFALTIKRGEKLLQAKLKLRRLI